MRTGLLLFVFYNRFFFSQCGNAKFEIIVEKATECPRPVPPFAKKRIFKSSFIIRKVMKKTYLSGEHRVLVELPFNNFSAHTFQIDDSGKQAQVARKRVNRMNCRSWLGKLFLASANFRYSKKDCRLQRGSYTFIDFDFDKMFHAVPSWHGAGKLLHRTQLVGNGSTIYCSELTVSVNT